MSICVQVSPRYYIIHSVGMRLALLTLRSPFHFFCSDRNKHPLARAHFIFTISFYFPLFASSRRAVDRNDIAQICRAKISCNFFLFFFSFSCRLSMGDARKMFIFYFAFCHILKLSLRLRNDWSSLLFDKQFEILTTLRLSLMRSKRRHTEVSTEINLFSRRWFYVLNATFSLFPFVVFHRIDDDDE